MTTAVWTTTALLFLAGLVMVSLRRQLLAMLLGVELMISAVNISLVYHAGIFSDAEALSAALLIIAIAAAEAVVGLSLILGLYATGRDVDSTQLRELHG